MTRSRTDQANDAASNVAQHRSTYEQCRAELAALTPAYTRLATAVAAYERPDVDGAARLGITWKQLALVARATTGVTAPWSSLQPEEREAAAHAAGIDRPAKLREQATAAITAYNRADTRTRAALAALYAAIREAATLEVTTQLDAVTDPAERRALAEDIAEQASLEMASLRPERDQNIAAAALYESREGLAADFGISYIVLRRIVSAALGNEADAKTPGPWPTDPEAAARTAGIPHIPDATGHAIALAQQHEAAEARRAAARAGQRAAHEAVRRAGGRVAVPAPERPDFEEIRRRATEAVRAEFAKLGAGPEERLRLASEAVDQADMEMAALLTERDQAFASLAFYTTVRAPYLAAGLSRQGGMNRTLGRALGLERDAKVPSRKDQPAAARAAGVPFVDDAETELPHIATAYEAASARRTAAIEIRNAILRTLNAEPYGWDQYRLADAIGRDVAIVNRALKTG
jgi:hypothetical protein